MSPADVISGLTAIEYLPQQQGLKLYKRALSSKERTTIEYLPQQQGLKLCS